MPGKATRFARFGWALAVGNYGRSLRVDLAVGVPGARDGGAVNVFYGRLNGVRAGHVQRWTQDSPGIPGGDELDDWFGGSLGR